MTIRVTYLIKIGTPAYLAGVPGDVRNIPIQFYRSWSEAGAVRPVLVGVVHTQPAAQTQINTVPGPSGPGEALEVGNNVGGKGTPSKKKTRKRV